MNHNATLRSFTRCTAVLLGAAVAVSCAPTAKNDQSAPAEGRTSRPNMTTSLDRVSAMQFDDYDPSLVIEAVNALQPLGKERALEEIDAYLENQGRGKESYGLFWVLRVLFDVPGEAGFPPVRLGQPTQPAPANASALPRFPIVMVRDVPFLVVRGYMLGGMPEPVEAHVVYFREHGTIRAAPLAPGPAPAGELEDELAQRWREAYAAAPGAETLGWIREQLARLER